MNPNYVTTTFVKKHKSFDRLKELQLFYHSQLYIVKIFFTVNNVYIVVTTNCGKMLVLGSGGSLKLKNSKKNTTYVLQLLWILILKKLKKRKIKFIILQLTNLKKKYRKIVLKYLQIYLLKLFYIQNLERIAYNGIKVKKKKRI